MAGQSRVSFDKLQKERRRQEKQAASGPDDTGS